MHRLRDISALHYLGLGFAAYVLLRSQDLYTFAYFASLGLTVWLGSRLRATDLFWLGFNCLIFIFAIAAFLFTSQVTFNPNILGCVFAIALAAALAYHQPAFIVISALALLSTHSRTAIVAGGFAFFVWIWRQSRIPAILLAIICVCILIIISDGRSTSFYNRMGIWQDTLTHITFWGQGLGSFADAYRGWAVHINMAREVAPHAYNDYLELIFELGIGAAALWLLLILTWERINPEAKLILGTFGILSLSFFPLYVPIIAHAGAIAFGSLIASPRPRTFEVYA